MNKLLKYFTVWKLRHQKIKTEFNQRLWNARKPLIEAQNKIDEEKKELSDKHKEIKRPTWSKILLVFLFINFTLLEIFIGWVTIKTFSIALAIGMMPDFTPLVTLIGVVIGHTISYGIYSSKSKAENTEGGITYEMARWQMEQGMYGNYGNDNMYGGGFG